VKAGWNVQREINCKRFVNYAGLQRNIEKKQRRSLNRGPWTVH